MDASESVSWPRRDYVWLQGISKCMILVPECAFLCVCTRIPIPAGLFRVVWHRWDRGEARRKENLGVFIQCNRQCDRSIPRGPFLVNF